MVQSRPTSGLPPPASTYAKRLPSGRTLRSHDCGESCAGSSRRACLQRCQRQLDDDVATLLSCRHEQRPCVGRPLRGIAAGARRERQNLSSAAADGAHDIDTPRPVAIGIKGNLASIWRPARPAIIGEAPLRQVHGVPAADLCHPDVVVADSSNIDVVGLKREPLPVWRPRRIALDEERRRDLNGPGGMKRYRRDAHVRATAKPLDARAEE